MARTVTAACQTQVGKYRKALAMNGAGGNMATITPKVAMADAKGIVSAKKQGTLVRTLRKVASDDEETKEAFAARAKKLKAGSVTTRTLATAEQGKRVSIKSAKRITRAMDDLLHKCSVLRDDQHVVYQDLFDSLPNEKAQARPAEHEPEEALRREFDMVVEVIRQRAPGSRPPKPSAE